MDYGSLGLYFLKNDYVACLFFFFSLLYLRFEFWLIRILNSGTMLVGFLCLQNILRGRFLKDLWLFLLIVNGFGIATGSIL